MLACQGCGARAHRARASSNARTITRLRPPPRGSYTVRSAHYASKISNLLECTAMQRLRLLFATLALVAVASFPAQPADDVKPPPAGYRHWFHVNTMIIDKASPLFKDLGGMHNVYANSVGEAALKKGGPYPDKSMFVTDLHDFTVSDGSYVEGARKGLAVMVKDSKKYASTGGWGFQFWEGGDPKKPQVTDAAKQCFACHQPKKDQDYVYSTYIP